MEPELIADYQCVVGEGPLWHEDEQRVYWTDIVTGRLFRYDPATGHARADLLRGEQVGGFTIQADGALLLFMERGKIATWRDGTLTTLIEEIPAERADSLQRRHRRSAGPRLLRHHLAALRRGRARHPSRPALPPGPGPHPDRAAGGDRRLERHGVHAGPAPAVLHRHRHP